MSIKEDILEILNTPTFYYKGIPMNALLLPALCNFKEKSIKNNYYYLHKNCYIKKYENYYLIDKKGERYLKEFKKIQLKKFDPIKNNGPKNLLLLYDIPEDMKKERDWFRRTLIKYNFVIVQKSVWVGPSPLPKEFLDYIKIIGLKNTIKTFKLEKGYDLKK